MNKTKYKQYQKYFLPKVEAMADMVCDASQLPAFLKIQKLLGFKKRSDFIWRCIEYSVSNSGANPDNLSMSFVSGMISSIFDKNTVREKFINAKISPQEIKDWEAYCHSYFKAFYVVLFDGMNELAKKEPPPPEFNKLLPAIIKLNKSYKYLNGKSGIPEETIEYMKENIPIAEIPYKELEASKKLKYFLEKKDVKSFITNLKSILASVPYSIQKEKEGYLHTSIYVILKILGFDIISEEATNIGRIDAVIRFSNVIYIFEFKDGIGEQALKQIKKKKYYEKFIIEGKQIILVGVGFDMERRNIKDDYKIEVFS